MGTSLSANKHTTRRPVRTSSLKHRNDRPIARPQRHASSSKVMELNIESKVNQRPPEDQDVTPVFTDSVHYYAEEVAKDPPVQEVTFKQPEDSYQLQKICQQSSKHTNQPMLALSSKVGKSSNITFSEEQEAEISEEQVAITIQPPPQENPPIRQTQKTHELLLRYLPKAKMHSSQIVENKEKLPSSIKMQRSDMYYKLKTHAKRRIRNHPHQPTGSLVAHQQLSSGVSGVSIKQKIDSARRNSRNKHIATQTTPPTSSTPQPSSKNITHSSSRKRTRLLHF